MRTLVISAVLLAAATGHAQVDTLWLRHHQQSISYPYQYMTSVDALVVDAGGNSYVCGYGQFEGSSFDFILLKYDPNGKLLWASNYDSGTNDYAYGLTLDDDGSAYVCGTSGQGSAYAAMVVKFRSTGGIIWSRPIVGDVMSYYNLGNAIAYRNGSVYVCGQIANLATGQDLMVAKLEAASGGVAWKKWVSRSVGNMSELATDLVLDGFENVYVGGRTYSALGSMYDASIVKYDKDGVLLWERDYNYSHGSFESFSQICLAKDLVVGTGYLSRTSKYDCLTVAWRADGQFQWVQIYDSTNSATDDGRDVASNSAGEVYVCGATGGNADQDLLLVKYASAGQQLWLKRLNFAGNDGAAAIALDQWENVVVSGGTSPVGGLEQMVLVAKYAPDGSQGWSYLLKGAAEGTSYLSNVKCLAADVIAAGTMTWPYPLYGDPAVLRLHEVPDVGVEQVLAPVGTIPAGVPQTPRAHVRNYSLLPAAFDCRLDIGGEFFSVKPVSLGPGGTQDVDFAAWTPPTHGNWLVTAYTELGLDYDRGNDTALAVAGVAGPDIDAGVRRLLKPDANIPYQATLVPTASIKNLGTTSGDVWAYMFLDKSGTRVYADSTFLPGLEPSGRDTVLEFAAWIAVHTGYLTAKCSTALAGDMDPANDVIAFSFGVINTPVGNWFPLTDLPPGSQAKPVHAGGGLAADGGALYALKGNKSLEVYRYGFTDAGWTALESLPPGPDCKPVRKGGSITADGLGRVYATKGNKTFEFYRYDPALGWSELSPVPAGPRGKLLAGGTGLSFLVCNDTGYVFLLKGSNTAEFYRYNVVRDSWDSMPDAPAGVSMVAKYKEGSGLCTDGESLVYCLKNKFNEVFAFDARSNRWLAGQLPGLPFEGMSMKRKKVKQGGDLCWADGKLAAIKGGSTREFWRLEPPDSNWYEYESVPYAGIVRRRVKDGAGLEFVGDCYYLLKGNKTFEAWGYRLSPSPRDGGLSKGLDSHQRAHTRPQSVVSAGYYRLTLGQRAIHPIVVSLHDATGRVVRVVAVPAGRNYADLDLRGLSAGVYLLAGNAATRAVSRFVVVR